MKKGYLILILLFIGTFVITLQGNTKVEAAVFESFEHTLIGNQVVITGYQNKSATTIEIPETISNMPVVEISDGAFSDCAKLTTIRIPSSVTYIGERAFNSILLAEINVSTDNAYYSSTSGVLFNVDQTELLQFPRGSSLTDYVIPNTVQVIEKEAFKDSKKLLSVSVSKDVVEIASSVFEGCSALTSVSLSEGLQYIGEYAFANCTKLSNMVLPSTLTKIERYAFQGCASIATMKIPSLTLSVGDYAFEKCTGLTSLIISEGVKTVGKGAFSGCNKIVSIIIPSTMTVIETETFSGCSALISVVTPETLTKVGQSAFLNCVKLTSITLLDEVKEIDDSAFSGCTALNKVVMTPGLERIGNRVFYNCKGLVNITLVQTITEIGEEAFYGCTGLTNIDIPELVTVLQARTFANCTGLKIINLHDDIIEIGEEVFFKCTKLTAADLPENLEVLGKGAFNGCTVLTGIEFPSGLKEIKDETFLGCAALKELVIPGSIERIGASAFLNAKGLTEIELLDGLEFIGEQAFSGCNNKSLISIIIPDSVREIGAGAFSGCSSLQEVQLPYDLTEISSSLFSGCSALQIIDLPNTVQNIGKNAFLGCKKLTSIELPMDLILIDDYAFSGCDTLANVVFQNNVSTIGEFAFSGAKALVYLEIPSQVNFIGKSAFMNCTKLEVVYFTGGLEELPENIFSGCSSLKEITMPEGLKIVGVKAFSGCKLLKEIDMPKTLVEIRANAFADCSALSKVSLKEGLIEIQASAFSKCIALQKIQIPSSVNIVGQSAFSGCSLLESATFLGNAPESFGKSVFSNASKTGFTVYMYSRSQGFTTPIWETYKCVAIEISDLVLTEPEKKSYLEGEELDLTGMVLVAHYTNGLSEEITNYTVSGFEQTPGMKTIVISYAGISRTFAVFVVDKSVTGIQITPPTKRTYQIGEELDLSGMVVTALYDNGTSNNVTGYVVSSFDPNQVGEQFITVTYMDYSKRFSAVVVPTTLSGITVEKQPTKLSYIEGEEFDTSGMIVKAVYSDGKQEEILIYDVLGYNNSVGPQIITVSYGGKTAQFVITMKAKTLISLEVTPPNKTTYFEGEHLDTTGMKIYAVYDSGLKEEVSNYEVSGYSSTAGIKTIVVKYQGKEITFPVTVTVNTQKTSIICETSISNLQINNDRVTFIVNINNKIQEKVEAMVVVVAYDSVTGRMLRIRIVPSSLESGLQTISQTIVFDDNASAQRSTINVFVWDKKANQSSKTQTNYIPLSVSAKYKVSK